MSGLRPARLVDISWQINENLTAPFIAVNTKSSTCSLQMTIEEPPSMEGEEPKRRTITMDLPPATVNTLVDDLTKIREQLANVARK